MNKKFYPIQVLVFLILLCSPFANYSQIQGNVFRDINNDGIRQSINPTENGEYGIVVNAHNAANVMVASVSTDAAGNYSINTAQAPSGTAVRLEFILPAGDFPSKRINANKSNIQFVTAGAAAVNIDFAIASKKLLANTTNPYVATTKYTNGNADSNNPGEAGTYDNLHVFPYNLSSNGGTSRRAKNQYTGSVFGLAWQRESRLLFMSAYLKRHCSFGKEGIGAIYQSYINASGVPAIPSLLLDVTKLGINVGADPRTTTLPKAATTPNTDNGVFAEVGKRGIGGIELSADGRDLYIVNMFEKKLHRINIGNPLKSSFSAADVTGNWNIPDPGLAGTVWHPMALKVHDNKFYIGGVCVKEITTVQNSTDTVNMCGIVYEFDPATNSFTEVLRFPLTHRRGYINQDYRYEYRNNYWSAWQNSGNISLGGPLRTGLNGATTGANATGIYYPQPMFSAIEFDVDGSMIIGIRDRFGDQGGYANFFETGNVAGEKYTTFSMGEMLRAGKSTTGFVLENAATVTSAGVSTTTTGLAGNNPPQSGTYVPSTGTPWGGNYGPGGKYYYYNQNFTVTGVPSPWNSPAALDYHYVKATGGLAFLPGSNEVLYTALDPTNLANTHGMLKSINLGSNAGNMIGRLHLLSNTSGNPDNMGKSAALGDLEILLDAAAMEIGNRIWIDANFNGIQDADESGFAGVVIDLRSPGLDNIYNNADDQLWQVTSDANGNYYFDQSIVNDNRRPASWIGVSSTNSGILPGFEYRLEILTTQTVLSGYILTSVNATNDEIDSDGAYSGAYIYHVINPGGSTASGSIFENDYNFDFGFEKFNILPDSRIDLSASENNNLVTLNWKTVNEFDVNTYSIERSTDGNIFYKTGTNSSKGNGSYSYNFTDDISSVSAGTIYYRIKSTGNNGKISYTQTVRILLNSRVKIAIRPNPFSNFINVEIFAKNKNSAVITLFTSKGQKIKTISIVLNKGNNTYNLNGFNNLPAGVYIIDIRTDEGSVKKKIIKQ